VSGSSSPLRVALIGTGWVSTHRHLPSLRSIPGVEVAGLIDRKPERAEEVARKYEISRRSSSVDLSGVDWLKEIDAVVIGTPPQTHHDIAAQALSLGKDVLTEKPFSVTIADGEDLVARSRAANRVLAIVHNFQFSRAFLRLSRDAASGRLGKITGFEAYQWSSPGRRLPVWYEEIPGGLFFDESPHLLYLLKALAGGDLRVRDASAVRTPGRRTPDLVTAFFEGSAVPVRMTLNFTAPVSEWFIAAFGDRAVGIADVFRNVYVRLPSDGLHVTRTVLRTSLFATGRHWLGQVLPGFEFLTGRAMYGNVEVMRRFARACRSGATPEAISAEDALHVLRLQHSILELAGLS
jgi:predicted dehydrogenase